MFKRFKKAPIGGETFSELFLSKLADVLFHPAFSLIITLILAVLWATNVINIFVGCATSVACFIALVWFSRASYIRKLPLLWRLVILLLVATFLALAGSKFGYWALTQYHQQKQLAQKPDTLKPLTAEDIAKEVLKKLPAQPPKNGSTKNSQQNSSEVQIKLVFKSSALLTPIRKNKITAELNSFRNYLVGLGFEVPKETPPIGTAKKGKGWAVGSGMGIPFADPILFGDIYIGQEVIDDPLTWRSAYANYVFEVILHEGLKEAVSLNRSRKNHHLTVMVLGEYFASSFVNRPPREDRTNGWVNALWDIRKSCGQDFMDRALYYTAYCTTKVKPQNEETDFNKYFYSRLNMGLAVVDDNFQNMPKIVQILKNYKLL